MTGETPQHGWKRTVLPWVGLAVVFTSNYWFPPVYRAVPIELWVLLLGVGFVFGVWRWIALFAEKWRA